MNDKVKNVLDFYLICGSLKDVVRTGWKKWNVKRDRVESVAEHIYKTQMLALAMKSEFNYDIDMYKVIFMLAIHEIGECVIGDFALGDITKEEKARLEHEAVHNILNKLVDSQYIEKLFLEFDAGETAEAKFAYQCDKLECDIQCKLYDQEKCVDLSDLSNTQPHNIDRVKKLIGEGYSWSSMWIEGDKNRIKFDENFNEVIDYLLKNNI